MKKKHDALKIVILSVLLVVVLFVVESIVILRDKGDYIQSYKQYCPMNCPNTLWTCTEGDIYFASDESGEVLGASIVDEKISYFVIDFDWSSRNFIISELNDISYPYIESLPFCFKGRASYSEDSCTLRYGASTDEDHYFGERERGEVTLTFIKSDLTAPFSFQSEESLNELPFR